MLWVSPPLPASASRKAVTAVASTPCARGVVRGSGRTGGSVLCFELREHLVRHVAVGVDVLHVVTVLERFDDPEHLLRAVLVERHLNGRQERGVRRVVVDAGG